MSASAKKRNVGLQKQVKEHVSTFNTHKRYLFVLLRYFSVCCANYQSRKTYTVLLLPVLLVSVLKFG